MLIIVAAEKCTKPYKINFELKYIQPDKPANFKFFRKSFMSVFVV